MFEYLSNSLSSFGSTKKGTKKGEREKKNRIAKRCAPRALRGGFLDASLLRAFAMFTREVFLKRDKFFPREVSSFFQNFFGLNTRSKTSTRARGYEYARSSLIRRPSVSLAATGWYSFSFYH